MRSHISRIAMLTALALLATAEAAAQASLSVMPPAVTVPTRQPTIQQARPLSIVWRIEDKFLQGAATSPAGFFRVGTTTLATVATPFAGGVGVPTVVFPEVVTIPADVILKAQRSSQGLTYERSFSGVDTFPLTEGVNIILVGDMGGPFEVTRLQLTFDDGTSLRKVDTGESIHPIAEMTYSGTGTIDAVWEVSATGSTQGEPIFRQIYRERRHVGAGGRIALQGPELPTRTYGLYFVRLRFVEPDSVFGEPLIRYQVAPPARSSEESPRREVSIALSAPGMGAPVDSETRFGWRRIGGAAVYQLEFFAVPAESLEAPRPEDQQPEAQETILVPVTTQAGERVAAVAVSADKGETTLPPAILNRLQPGTAYFFRVLGLDADGETVGRSAFREIRRPL